MTYMAPSLDLSVVIPIYHEQDNITPLYEELSAALNALNLRYEVIAVDDGSRDASFARLKDVHASDPRWQIIQFRRNFGQTAAMAAGFTHSRGAVVVTIDADLQNDPRDIVKLLAKMDEGYDIVSGWRQDRWVSKPNVIGACTTHAADLSRNYLQVYAHVQRENEAGKQTKTASR